MPANRKKILELVRQTHHKHASHGYRWVHAYLVRTEGIEVSAEYIRRAFKYLGIAAKTKHQKKTSPRKVKDPYPNLIFSTWKSVYTSMAYNKIIKEHNIVRSCSWAGKPTDNPVNESLNGWIKEELYTDFDLYNKDPWQAEELIREYIKWYNAERPCYSLDYKTPNEFYEQFVAGQIEHRDTFKDRILDERPKLIRQKLEAAEKSAGSRHMGTRETSIGRG